MQKSSYNFQHFIAHSAWERRTFLHQWWRLAQNDPHWLPPGYNSLKRELDPRWSNHLRRLNPLFIYIQAMVRTKSMRQGMMPIPALPEAMLLHMRSDEATLCTAVVLQKTTRQDAAACLALLQCANASDGLEQLLDEISVDLAEQGVTKIVAPTGLSAYVETGALQDCWDRLPPLLTPYHPPYMAELLASLMDPCQDARLFHLPVPAENSSPIAIESPALRFLPLDPLKWQEEISLPLFQAACPAWSGFRSPDEAEIQYLKHRLSCWPVDGWLAQVNGQTVGFILLLPDLSAVLRRAHGGRGWFGWLLLQLGLRLPARAGRVPFGGVLPGWRNRGIGSELLLRALNTAALKGWRSLVLGPVPVEWPGGAFLERRGAQPDQTYRLYHRDLT